jgi:NAD(P)H-hydrate repair Nnr-like enzyme with NAD(P)H-hydrate dehydratase domain
MSLAGCVIRILPYDNHFHFVKRTLIESIENEFCRRINGFCAIFLTNKIGHLIVIIKGAYSLIIDSENLYVNNSGTPALATAGSGDVLTGIITSLLAQGYEPIDAAKIGVYLHGLTANLTQKTIHPRSFVASDIIDNIGNAYFNIEKNS